MRVAYVCLDPGVPVFGRKGSSVHCQEVMRAFQKRGDEVELFAKRLGDDVPKDLEKIKTHRLGGKLNRDPAQRERELIALNDDLKQALSDAGPFDVVYERYSLWSHSAMEFARGLHIHGILEINSPLIQEQKTYRTLVDEDAALTIRDKCFGAATSLITVSKQVAAKFRDVESANKKITAVTNGVNCEKFLGVTRTSDIDSQIIVIGFVGTLKPWHGVSNLIDSFVFVREQFPNARLKIVGDGPERENLESQLARHSEDMQQAVEWLGAVANSEIPAALADFDIGVAPYPELYDFYFSPLKILEYMAASLPIVASDIGQIPELIRQDTTGLLVQPGCASDLTQKLLRLCGDPALRTRLGSAARHRAESNHTWDHVVENIMATIQPSHCEAC